MSDLRTVEIITIRNPQIVLHSGKGRVIQSLRRVAIFLLPTRNEIWNQASIHLFVILVESGKAIDMFRDMFHHWTSQKMLKGPVWIKISCKVAYQIQKERSPCR